MSRGLFQLHLLDIHFCCTLSLHAMMFLNLPGPALSIEMTSKLCLHAKQSRTFSDNTCADAVTRYRCKLGCAALANFVNLSSDERFSTELERI